MQATSKLSLSSKTSQVRSLQKLPNKKTNESNQHTSTTKVSDLSKSFGLGQEEIKVQIEKAKLVLDELKEKHKNEKEVSMSVLSKVKKMEHKINSKNKEIKSLEEQIKELKSGNYMPDKKSNLSEEIEEALSEIAFLKNSIIIKKKINSEAKMRVDKVYKIYEKKCQEMCYNVISLDQVQRIRNSEKSQVETTKFIPKEFGFAQKTKAFENREVQKDHQFGLLSESKTIKDILTRKNVAEAALKAERRKHMNEINNYLSKLEFLKGEEEVLQDKLYLEIKSLEKASKKFSESKNGIKTSDYKRKKANSEFD